MLSVVTAIPYLFFEIWRFISPALYPNERKGVRKALTVPYAVHPNDPKRSFLPFELSSLLS